MPVKGGPVRRRGRLADRVGNQQLADLRGAARRYPVLGAAATAAALALAGVPPLSLWATKDEILVSVAATPLRVVTLAAAALSAVYAGRIIATVWAHPTGVERLDDEEPGTRRVPRAAAGVAEFIGSGRPDLLVLMVDAGPEHNRGLYRVGRGVDQDGV
jgi:NADH-quinone oxidoreductase subunit L